MKTKEQFTQDQDWFKKTLAAAETGDVDAMVAIGAAYLDGLGTEPDRELATQWTKKAADAGNAVAMWHLGTQMIMRDCDPVTKQPLPGTTGAVEGLKLVQAASDKGDAMATTCLATMCKVGIAGIPKDLRRYAELTLLAAIRGNILAIARMADIYAGRVEGLDADAAKEVEWNARLRVVLLNKAEAGDVGAGVAYGVLLLADNTPESDAKAIPWLQKGAAAGGATAMTARGECYAAGRGVPQDYEMAADWRLRGLMTRICR